MFFKGRDADVLTAAFKEFSAKKLTQEQKPSIRKALAAFRDKAKQLNASRDVYKRQAQIHHTCRCGSVKGAFGAAEAPLTRR